MSIGDAGKTDGVSLLHGSCLKAPVIGRATDDDASDPLKDFFLLLARPRVEIVGQMPGEPAPFGRVDVVKNMAGGRPRRVWEFCFEISLRQPVSLDAAE
ncbi:hypothetical protein [Mesorhizobium sp. CA4]|uniref:hypothetical protein n=1 Tax=Mesorhizobium sp. CA4 TaxID=588499 RepID=UPI001CD1607B|nr:hypothetical protein [Mesorhizobium sp. CA4]MBZ9823199.1 hypothetical protein [Mesorhizobium sp. CA4]